MLSYGGTCLSGFRTCLQRKGEDENSNLIKWQQVMGDPNGNWKAFQKRATEPVVSGMFFIARDRMLFYVERSIESLISSSLEWCGTKTTIYDSPNGWSSAVNRKRTVIKSPVLNCISRSVHKDIVSAILKRSGTQTSHKTEPRNWLGRSWDWSREGFLRERFQSSRESTSKVPNHIGVLLQTSSIIEATLKLI